MIPDIANHTDSRTPSPDEDFRLPEYPFFEPSIFPLAYSCSLRVLIRSQGFQAEAVTCSESWAPDDGAGWIGTSDAISGQGQTKCCETLWFRV